MWGGAMRCDGLPNHEWKSIMAKLNDLHKKWLKNPEYKKAHEALAPEFALARAAIEARVKAGLTQQQLQTS